MAGSSGKKGNTQTSSRGGATNKSPAARKSAGAKKQPKASAPEPPAATDAGATRMPPAIPTPPTEGGRRGWALTARPWLGAALRILLAVVWILAGARKVGDPAAFVRAVRAYQVVPEWLAKGMGYGMPFVEIAIGVLILLGIGTRLVAAASAFFLVIFLVGIIQASARGLQIECGCFGGGGKVGAGQSTTYTWDILRDFGLLLASAFLLLWPVTKFAADDYVRAGGAPDPMTQRVGPRRTKEAQRRLAALQEQRRKEGRKRVLTASAATALVLIAVGLIGVGVQAHRAGTQAGPSATPTIAAGDGIAYGKAGANVTVDLYEDFLCPICNEFEKTDGATIKQLADTGKAKFVYHSVAILDGNSAPAGYSTRAAAAAACAPNTTTWKKLHDLLYTNQPTEGSAGLATSKLASLGKQAGATDASFSQCVTSQKYKGWVAKQTDDFSKAKLTGTPTIQIKGEDVKGSAAAYPSPAELKKAVAVGHGTSSGTTSKGGGSTLWVVVAIIVVVIGVIAVFLWPRRRSPQRGRR